MTLRLNRVFLSLATLTLAAAVSSVACTSSDGAAASSDQQALWGFPNLPADYEQLSAQAKYDILWNQRLTASKYANLPEWPSVDLIGIGRADMSITLNRRNDELPVGRKKLVHALGVCAGVELVTVTENNPFSGMYKSGGKGIARLSLAAPPGSNNFTPGLALKMFVDKMPSENIQSMYSIDGQGRDFNFFSNRFSNIIAEPTGVGTNLIGAIFKQATPFPNFIDAEPMGRYDNAGTLTSPPKSPRQIFWVPTDEIKQVGRYNSPNVDFRKDLARIPANTPIYKLVGFTSADSPWIEIGHLVTRTAVEASGYCDEKLFFNHPESSVAP